MGWENRAGGRYYYHKVREGGKVRSVYGGYGPAVEAISALEDADRLRRAAERERRQVEQASALAADQMAEEEFREVQTLFRDYMTRAGWHRPKRDKWRKKRMGEAIEKKPTGLTKAEESDLFKKAKTDSAAADRYFEAFEQEGKIQVLIDAFTDRRLRAVYAYSDLRLRKAYQIRMKQLEEDLQRPDDSAIAKLLIESAALCWLRVAQSEDNLSVHLHKADGYNAETAGLLDKLLDRASKRFTATLLALATVRRIQLPAVQVNIADKQLNIAA